MYRIRILRDLSNARANLRFFALKERWEAGMFSELADLMQKYEIVELHLPLGVACFEIEHFPLIAFGGGYITNNQKVIMRNIIPSIDALRVLETIQQWGCEHITAFSGNHWAVQGTDPITEFETEFEVWREPAGPVEKWWSLGESNS